MCRKNLRQCDDGEELADYALHHGAEPVRDSGDHRILRLPNGQLEMFPRHRKQIGKGLKSKIIKHLLAAGISVLSLGMLVLSLL